ncbi:hypothetical protein Tco_0829551, partial [Tanacetum coccineum]
MLICSPHPGVLLGFDRLWFPHPGVLLGSMTRQPFICPLDHVFEVQTMLKALPEEEFGPGISIRDERIHGSMYNYVKKGQKIANQALQTQREYLDNQGIAMKIR